MKIGFLGVVQIVFVILKVADKIDWSWWVVFIPTYLSVIGFLFLLGLALIASVLDFK